MKKLTKLLAGAALTCTMIFAAACGPTGNTSTGGDSGTSVEKTTATYRMEYYLEGDNGYELDATKTEEKSGEVGTTATIEKKEIDGYIFESDHKSNVVRGKILADNSLVLKAYYSKDYTGRVVFETELEDSIDILKGGETTLAVTVKVNGEAVTEGVNYTSSYKVVDIDENGVMTGKMRGEADVSVSYKNVSKTFHVTVYDAYIATEEDWWGIYDHLGYWYKLTADITLSESSVEHFTVPAEGDKAEEPGWLVNHTFEGVLDGGGHSLTYTGSRLFHWVSGSTTVIRNITLNASEGFYWGSTIAYGMDGQATVENVTVNAQFKDSGCYRAVSADFWIELGGDDKVKGNGGMFGMLENATISDCTVILDITKLSESDASHFGGICYQAKNSVVKNCKVISTNDSVSVVEEDKGGATITDSSVVGMQEAEYKVEYYLETDDGYVKDDTLSHTETGFVGKTVTESLKPVQGYAFDETNENNVLSGVVREDGSLVLKVYYKRLPPEDAGYTVKYYFETETGFEENLGMTQTLTGKIGAEVNLEQKTVEGYQFDAENENNVLSGTITADGALVLKAYYKVAVTLIGTADEFWAIYDSEASLAGNYRLTADITLKVIVEGAEVVGSITGREPENYKINNNFTGKLDGDGHTLTYSGGRLFHTISGTIQNITINAGKDHYWGSALAYTVKDAVLRDIVITAEFSRENTYQYVEGEYVEAKSGAGVFDVWVDGATIEDCVVNVTLSGRANPAYYSGIAYNLKASKVTNITVNSSVAIELYTQDGGNNVVTGSEVVVDDGYIMISTEADWWAIYASDEALAGNYRFANDITLTTNSCVNEGEKYKINYVFKGNIDGNGHTLNYSDARLFYEVYGTIENLTLNATSTGESGFYWGSALAFTIKNGAVLKNITLNVEFKRADTHQFVADNDYRSDGSGALCVWLENSTLENVTINVTLSEGATAAYYAGIAFNCTGTTLKNVSVNSASELVAYKAGERNTEENVTINKIS
ncbi:MAG: MucBP domain-containing protein [Christensenellaceae bacterium]